MRRWFAASRVEEITGILNATSNFVLTRMRDGTASYEEALNEAVLQGIAEADPRLYVEGFDTAIKLVILARGLMDPAANFAAGQIHGIADLSADLVRAQAGGGGRIRLIGRAVRENGRATISVASRSSDPLLRRRRPEGHPLPRRRPRRDDRGRWREQLDGDGVGAVAGSDRGGGGEEVGRRLQSDARQPPEVGGPRGSAVEPTDGSGVVSFGAFFFSLDPASPVLPLVSAGKANAKDWSSSK